MTEHQCMSCGMSIDDGSYCAYCVDADGNLQSFEERFERMMQWALKKNPGISPQEAKQQTRAYMKTMPAWQDHPSLQTD